MRKLTFNFVPSGELTTENEKLYTAKTLQQTNLPTKCLK